MLHRLTVPPWEREPPTCDICGGEKWGGPSSHKHYCKHGHVAPVHVRKDVNKRPQSDTESEHPTEQLNRISQKGYALIDDGREDMWLSVGRRGGASYILRATLHSNGTTTSKEIPAPLARDLIHENGLMFEEPPEAIQDEVNQVDRI